MRAVTSAGRSDVRYRAASENYDPRRALDSGRWYERQVAMTRAHTPSAAAVVASFAMMLAGVLPGIIGRGPGARPGRGR